MWVTFFYSLSVLLEFDLFNAAQVALWHSLLVCTLALIGHLLGWSSTLLRQLRIFAVSQDGGVCSISEGIILINLIQSL